MIISIDSENVFDKIEHPFMILKRLSTRGHKGVIKGTYFDITRVII